MLAKVKEGNEKKKGEKGERKLVGIGDENQGKQLNGKQELRKIREERR